MNTSDIQNKILILGIGNFLMGDEGIGVHVVRQMEKENLPRSAELLDGGTGGFSLLGEISGYTRAIIIDATIDGAPPGTLKHLKPKYVSDYPSSLSAHDIGLKDLIEAMTLLNQLPEIDLITVSVKDIDAISVELSPEVRKQIPAIIHKVKSLL